MNGHTGPLQRHLRTETGQCRPEAQLATLTLRHESENHTCPSLQAAQTMQANVGLFVALWVGVDSRYLG